MKTSRYTEAQTLAILRQAEGGMIVRLPVLLRFAVHRIKGVPLPEHAVSVTLHACAATGMF